MSAVLVTGGAGYIGSHTANQLIAAGKTVVILDDLSTGFKEAIPTKCFFVQGRIEDQDLLKKTLLQNHVTSILHFAGSLVVSESVSNPLKYYRNNVVNTLSLIEIAEQCQVKHLVFSSTAAVYGNPDHLPVTETSPTFPMSPYGHSKLMVEQILRDACSKNQITYANLRYFNVAGSSIDGKNGLRAKNATHLIQVACEVALGARPSLEIFGTDYETKDGTGLRDYIHVEDLAQLHVKALQYLESGGSSDTFNCGYGHGFTVKEVVASLQKASGKKINTLRGPPRPGDIGAIFADVTKAKTKLQWIPQFDDLHSICQSHLSWESKK